MKNLAHLAIGLACLTGAALIVNEMGIAAHMGAGAVDVGLGPSDFGGMDRVGDGAEADPQGGDSIVGMALAALEISTGLFAMVIFFPIVMTNLGFPLPIVVAVSLPIYVLASILSIELLRGVSILPR